ncbi:MAG TPA: glycosyltransferase family 2 protein [Syntrophobacteria bacterium]|nr:glycosyltransferase family 2 protein [Syntrophobacteria bacterium]
MRKRLSIMTPCYNEEAGIRECYERIKEVFESRLSQYDYEHIFIDNASTDKTVDILKNIAAADKKVRIIVNSRNFGLSRSPYYGMLQMSGDAVIPVVADLQTPPEVIPEFVRKWEEGYKMVLGVRTGMEEGRLSRWTRNTFYRVITRLSNVEQVKHFIGFGLLDRHIIEILKALDDPSPYLRGLVSEIGFEKALVEYHQPPRKHGKSRHSFFDLLELALLGLTSYSKAPLRLMTIIGFVVACLSLVAAVGYFIVKLVFWRSLSIGMAPILIGTFFFASIQLLCLGLVGEYVGLIFELVKHRPLVIEKERINFD